MFPLSFIDNIYLISFVEFFLGISTASVGFSEKNYSQLICEKTHLGKLFSVKQMINVSSKFITIFIVAYIVKIHYEILISPVISIFFLASGIYLHSKTKLGMIKNEALGGIGK